MGLSGVEERVQKMKGCGLDKSAILPFFLLKSQRVQIPRISKIDIL